MPPDCSNTNWLNFNNGTAVTVKDCLDNIDAQRQWLVDNGHVGPNKVLQAHITNIQRHTQECRTLANDHGGNHTDDCGGYYTMVATASSKMTQAAQKAALTPPNYNAANQAIVTSIGEMNHGGGGGN